MDEARSVREFWFGRLPLSADALNRRMPFWFAGPPSELGRLRDEHIRERFGELLDPVERMFFYMPLQHAESREVQDESVAAYRRLRTEAPEQLFGPFAGAARSANNHRAIIERFGRFPHRNQVLGRENTPAEEEWLRKAGTSFPQ